ncbi:hypothetical protein I4F81_004766 [Pyropia yezoensis]|uniref:Uncharacterized protein n=1 Tax=Pyropia yezoensis TaxID=2788 RepID=A0ACC3BXI5_PYRYE|nr:hypothetical protein I4F81_004766 [Neopyropia yezoensis]
MRVAVAVDPTTHAALVRCALRVPAPPATAYAILTSPTPEAIYRSAGPVAARCVDALPGGRLLVRLTQTCVWRAVGLSGSFRSSLVVVEDPGGGAITYRLAPGGAATRGWMRVFEGEWQLVPLLCPAGGGGAHGPAAAASAAAAVADAASAAAALSAAASTVRPPWPPA